MRRLLPALFASAFLLPWTGAASAARAGEETTPVTDASIAAEVERASILDAGARRAQARDLVAKGDQLQALHHYEDARWRYEQALALDPDYTAAAEKLREVKAYLVADPNDPATVIRQVEDTAQVRQMLQKAEAQSLIGTAEKMIAEASARAAAGDAESVQRAIQDLNAALEALARARLKLDSIPGRIDVTDLRLHANRLEASAKNQRAALQEKSAGLAREQAIQAAQKERQVAEDYRREQQKMLLDRASEHTRLHQWDEAEAVLRQLILDDPNHARAREMLLRVRADRYAERRDEVLERAEVERAATLRDLDKRTIMKHGNIIYPDSWDEIVKRSTRETGLSAGAVPEWKLQILKKMEEPITFDFEGMELPDVIRFLRTFTGVNFVLDTQADEAASATINLKVENMRLDNALKWIMTITSLDYELRDEAVFIATKDSIKGAWETRVYDISDLAIPITDATAIIGGGEDDDDGVGGGEEGRAIEEIIQLIAPETWSEGGGSVNRLGNNLVIYQTESVQRLVLETLEQLRAAQAIQVAITARFLQVREQSWEELSSRFGQMATTTADDAVVSPYWGFANTFNPGSNYTQVQDDPNVRGVVDARTYFQDFRDPATGQITQSAFDYSNDTYGAHHTDMRGWVQGYSYPALLSVFGSNLGSTVSETAGLSLGVHQLGWLGAFETQWVLRMLRETQGTDELFAPHLICYNNKRAWIMVTSRIPYTRGYSIGSGGGYQPENDEIMEGTILMVRPTVSSDKRYISVDIQARVDRLLQFPMDRRNISVQAGAGVNAFNLPIDLPTVATQETRTYATLPDGGSILVSGMGVNLNNRAQGGVPVLSDIPVVGKLFSTRIYQSEKRKFMLLLNARMILLDEEEAKLAQ